MNAEAMKRFDRSRGLPGILLAMLLSIVDVVYAQQAPDQAPKGPRVHTAVPGGPGAPAEVTQSEFNQLKQAVESLAKAVRILTGEVEAKGNVIRELQDEVAQLNVEIELLRKLQNELKEKLARP